ncbi:MAG TPA: serine hydrolase, partial [Methyloceanibacter sp.]|nr:serine hydrolase [Methyloceanibacter sp.]
MPASPASSFSFRKAWPWLLAAAVVGIAVGVAGVWLYGIADKKYREAQLGSAVMAKNVCSGVFISRRTPEDILATDLSGPPYERLTEFKPNVDRDAKRVTASYCLFGPKWPMSCLIGKQTAIFREGLGCTVVDTTDDALRAQSPGLPPPAPVSNPEALWPEGERVDLEGILPGVDRAVLQAAVDTAFDEPDPKCPRRTRALVVVHDGRIVAEKYAPGFDATTPLNGWSMAKTATNALAGLRVEDGKLVRTDKDLLKDWRGEGDQRRRDITLDELLRMTSGLAFSEDYDSDDGDARQMLYIKGDKSGFAAAKPLKHTPGTY